MTFKTVALALTLTLGLTTSPPPGCPAAQAQVPGRTVRIGFLTGDPAPQAADPSRAALVEALGELGYVEGQSFALEARSAEGKLDRLPALAAELAGLKVDVLVATPLAAARAARQASAAIPIVAVLGPDPAEAESLGRLALRDRNLTGVTRVPPALATRLLELLKEAVPTVSRVAVLRPMTPSPMALGERDLRFTARGLRVRVQTVVARGAAQLEAAFDEVARERLQAVIVSEHPALLPHRARLAELAAARGFPWVADLREFAEAGALLSYGPGPADLFRRAAGQVDRILKGARPGDLSIEPPSRFELILNLNTAKTLERVFPVSLLTQADASLE